jgi:predicted transcriptional regulator
MTEEEIATVLAVTPRTVRRYWAYAQARLYEDLTRH